VRKT
jgi:hypothetical protein